MFGEDLPTGGRPRFGVAKPAPEGMVSIMPFPGDGVTPFPEDRKQMTRPEKIEKFGKPTVGPRKGPPKKRAGGSRGKAYLVRSVRDWALPRLLVPLPMARLNTQIQTLSARRTKKSQTT